MLGHPPESMHFQEQFDMQHPPDLLWNRVKMALFVCAIWLTHTVLCHQRTSVWGKEEILVSQLSAVCASNLPFGQEEACWQTLLGAEFSLFRVCRARLGPERHGGI